MWLWSSTEGPRRDERLGPVFEAHVHEWDVHLARMTDFWSAALLRSGRYSGRPVERHRAIDHSVSIISAAGSSCSNRRARTLPACQADAFMVRTG